MNKKEARRAGKYGATGETGGLTISVVPIITEIALTVKSGIKSGGGYYGE